MEDASSIMGYLQVQQALASADKDKKPPQGNPNVLTRSAHYHDSEEEKHISSRVSDDGKEREPPIASLASLAVGSKKPLASKFPKFSASSFFGKKTNYKNPKTFSTLEIPSQAEYFESKLTRPHRSSDSVIHDDRLQEESA
jgi:hypothetical protein